MSLEVPHELEDPQRERANNREDYIFLLMHDPESSKFSFTSMNCIADGSWPPGMPVYHSLRSATVAAGGTKSQTRRTSQLRETERVIRCARVWHSGGHWAEHSLIAASSRGTTATGGAEQCDIWAYCRNQVLQFRQIFSLGGTKARIFD